ncbi:MAG: beta-N-acetylhexosaminidase [Bdellovibrionaceae bacterium]|nr:beta-N-acetylhexosaminidase [Pseudobdellovibrionaceae bacterium]
MIEKVGQHLIIGLRGTSLLPEEREFIIKYNIGGVILFDRNVKTPEQIHALTTELHSLREHTKDHAPLIVSIDMEGGRVHRLKSPFTFWPALKNIGDIGSSSLAFRFALHMGEELRAFGINLDFAPCIDVYMNPKNEVIGDRAISTQAEVVTQLSSALVRGYLKAGVIPCAKHFPGHGATEIDSHFELPISDETLMDLDKSQSLEPFKKVFKSRCDLVMTAHIHYKKIDAKWPVTLSPTFLKQILRDVLRYRGLIITDDLDMKALAKYFPKDQIPVQALNAGANILLYCNDFDSPGKAMNSIARAIKEKTVSVETIEKNYSEILAFKKKHIQAPQDPFPLEKALEVINRPEHKEFALAVASGKVDKYLQEITNEDA